MKHNIVYLVSVQVTLLQGFFSPVSARPNLAATLSRLGFSAVPETIIPNAMLSTPMIPNMPCGSNYRVGPSCFTGMPITEAIIPSNIASNVIPPRMPVTETVISNGNVVSNFIPNVYRNVGLPVAETLLPVAETLLPNVAPFTTLIQDSSVSNSLANALQLLVVSNLLSNTLPSNDANDIALPRFGTPVFEKVVRGGCVNAPLLESITPCGNIVNFL